MILSFITSLFIAIQDPIIQKFAVRIAGGWLSEKTGADVKIGKIYIDPNFTVHADDIEVKDQRDSTLVRLGGLKAKLHVQDILNGDIHLGTVELRDTEANLIKYRGEDGYNFQFIADALKSDKKKDKDKKSGPIRIDRIKLDNIDFMLWDQNKENPEKTKQKAMDYAHLDLDDINLDASDLVIVGDSIHTIINDLDAKELSGFEVNDMHGNTTVSSKGILIDDLHIKTNNSQLHLDLHMLYNDYSAFNTFVDSVIFDSKIYPTDIMLSDIGAFAPVMYEMPDRILFECLFKGPIEHFSIDDLSFEFGEGTHFDGSMTMHPLDFNDGQHTLNIKKMHYTYDDLVNFHIPGNTGTIPLPESLKPMDEGTITGNFKGSYHDFIAETNITSNAGDIGLSIAKNLEEGLNVFSSEIQAKRIDVGSLANASNTIGNIDLTAKIDGKIKPGFKDAKLDIKGDAFNAHVLGNTIDKIKLNGKLNEKQFKGLVNIKDNELDLDFNGMFDFNNPKLPHADFEAVINKADLHSLNINKKDDISVISANVTANLVGFDMDDLEGSLHIDDLRYVDSNGLHQMNQFDASIVNDNLMQRQINVNCDFFNYEMGGVMDFASLPDAFKLYVNKFTNIPKWRNDIEKLNKRKNVPEQDFFVNLNIKDAKPITDLFMPNVQIAKNTSLNGTFTSKADMLNLTLRSKGIKINDILVDNIEVKNYSTSNSSVNHINIKDIIFRDSTEYDKTRLGIENLDLITTLKNDSVFGDLRWNDEELISHNKAKITTSFVPSETGGRFNITSADILINDSLWTVHPDNYIVIDGDRTQIHSISLNHRDQHIILDGYVPLKESDTLQADFDNFNISTLDLIFAGLGFDLDGQINGNLQASNIKNDPTVFADLNIEQLALNKEIFGDVAINSRWDNARNAVFIDASLTDEQKQTFALTGEYYPTLKKDNLDFRLSLDQLKLALLEPFVKNAASRIQGFADGDITVKGSLDKPVITGDLNIKDGGCKIGFLNTFYTFNPTIRLREKSIDFENFVLTDTLGQKANLEGNIRHDHLKDFRFDLRLLPRDFLAMATTAQDNSSFYGTAVANGIVEVKGSLDDIRLDIRALTRDGTSITLPLGSNGIIKDKDYIIFINKEDEIIKDLVEDFGEVKPESKKKNNFSIGLNISATPDADLRIILPSNIGVIDATGEGNVKIGSNSTGDFSLIGDYVIENGRLQINYKNLISKNLKLEPGGKLSWTGDPLNGTINATGVYSTSTTVSSLGLVVDSTSRSSNKLNVDCLIRLSGALLNPNISFGLRLPNATEDIQQTVFTMLDTTNQAVMTQQAVSLLILNSFSNVGTANSYQGSSGYLDVFTAQINNWISELSQNVDIGVHYRPGDEISNEELQIALKTQLFDNRLTIETNFGMVNPSTSNANTASNIVGDVDVYLKLSKDGHLQAHAYNHSNNNSYFYNYTYDKLSPYTQGIGISYTHSFNRFRDIIKKKPITVSGRPVIPKPKNDQINDPK